MHFFTNLPWLGPSSPIYQMGRNVVIIGFCVIAFIASISTYLPPAIICHLPSVAFIVPSCRGSFVTLVNLNKYTEMQNNIIANSRVALGSNSTTLFDLHTAIRDVVTQIKYSDLTETSKENFELSLIGLAEATLKSAESITSLEVMTLVTLRYFKQYNMKILEALQFLIHETMSTRDKHRIANIKLSETFFGVLSNMENDLQKLELQGREFLKHFNDVDINLHKASATLVENNKIKTSENTRLWKIWSTWGKHHIYNELYKKNLTFLYQYESNDISKEMLQMLTCIRWYLEDIPNNLKHVRYTSLETEDVIAYIANIKLVNDVIEHGVIQHI